MNEGEIKSETLGLAKLGGMCEVESSCSVNTHNGLPTAFTIAHELAHNLNADHDVATCIKTNAVMPDSVKYDTNILIWSECSRDAINKFIEFGNFKSVNKKFSEYKYEKFFCC